MATMNISVTTNIPKSGWPYLLSESYVDNDCLVTMTIRVPVPAGQTRYISVAYVNATGTPFTNTINTTTDYVITVEGNRSFQTDQNNQFSTGSISVALTNISPFFYSRQITRQHTGNIC